MLTNLIVVAPIFTFCALYAFGLAWDARRDAKGRVARRRAEG